MGIDYTLSPPGGDSAMQNFTTKPQQLIAVQSYEWLAQDIQIFPHQQADSLQIGDRTFFLSVADDSLNLRLSFEDKSQQNLIIPVESLAKRLLQKYSAESYGLSPEEMAVNTSNDQWQVKVYFRNLSLQETDNGPYLESAQLDLLLKVIQNE
jgi:hypothetical protein